MGDHEEFRTTVDAARTLIEWKTSFADNVTQKAKQIAITEGTQVLSLKHYQLAAEAALELLSTAIQDENTRDDAQRKAA